MIAKFSLPEAHKNKAKSQLYLKAIQVYAGFLFSILNRPTRADLNPRYNGCCEMAATDWQDRENNLATRMLRPSKGNSLVSVVIAWASWRGTSKLDTTIPIRSHKPDDL